MIIRAEHDTLSMTEDQNTYSGSKNYYQVTFQFSDDWEAFSTRHAVFIRSETEVEDRVIPSDGVVDIPNAFLEYESAIEVGCYGVSGDARRTTNLVKLLVEEGSYRAGERTMPAPDIFQQYLDQIIAYTESIDFDSAIKDVPAGGTTGQVLSKKSDTDFDTEWRTESAHQQGIPAGGGLGQVLAKASASDYDVSWKDDAQADNLNDIAVVNTSEDNRYNGLNSQKQINEKISTDIASKADISHNHNEIYLEIAHGTLANNPHAVTKAQLGLENVANTADADKPVSIAMQTAIDEVNKVFSYADVAAFPAMGTDDTIYIAEDTNKTYRWTGSVFVEIGGGTGNGLSGREVLTGARTYYVDPAGGSDSADGLTTSTPFLTIQHAIDVVASLDISIYDVTIDLWSAVGSGTVAYNIGSTSILAADPVGSGSVSIIGNAMDNNTVQITCAGNVICFDGTRKYCVYDLTLVSTAGNCLYVFNSVVQIGGLKTTASSSVIYANSKSIVNIHNRTTNVFTVYGAIVYFALAVTHSVFNAYDVDFNTTNLTAITSWLYVASMSFMDFRTSTYTKTAVSGSKYSVNENSVLYSASGGTILPGNSGGSTATNGLAL